MSYFLSILVAVIITLAFIPNFKLGISKQEKPTYRFKIPKIKPLLSHIQQKDVIFLANNELWGIKTKESSNQSVSGYLKSNNIINRNTKKTISFEKTEINGIPAICEVGNKSKCFEFFGVASKGASKYAIFFDTEKKTTYILSENGKLTNGIFIEKISSDSVSLKTSNKLIKLQVFSFKPKKFDKIYLDNKGTMGYK